jgi:hypothetical protein
MARERYAPEDHTARSWPETMKFAEEEALTVQALHNLFLTLRKDANRCMEHLGLGWSAYELVPEEGTKNCGPHGVKGEGPCGDVSVSQSKLGQEEVAHRLKPGLSGLVYQRRNPKSTAFWRVKQGTDKSEVGMSQSWEKVAIHYIVGDEAIVPVPEGALRDGGGETNVSLLVKRQPEELVVGTHGSDSECVALESRQSELGFGLDEVEEVSGMVGIGYVVEEGTAQVLSEVGGGLLRAPQISSCSPSIAVMENSGSGSEFVDQRKEEGNLELVTCSTKEVKVGGYTAETFSVGKQVESFFGEREGGKMEIGFTSKGVVGEEEGVLYEFSLDMQDYLPEDLLLQYEEEDIKRDLERCELLVLTPLAMDGGDGHHTRVSPRWVVERVESFYQVVRLSCEGYEDKLLALFEEIEAARDLSMLESKKKRAAGIK